MSGTLNVTVTFNEQAASTRSPPTEHRKGERRGAPEVTQIKEKLHKALAGQLTRWRERHPLAATRRRRPGSPAPPALSVYSGPWGGSDWLGLLWGIPIGQSSRHHPPAVVFGSAPKSWSNQLRRQVTVLRSSGEAGGPHPEALQPRELLLPCAVATPSAWVILD